MATKSRTADIHPDRSECHLPVRGDDAAAVAKFTADFREAAYAEQAEMIKQLRQNNAPNLHLSKKDSKVIRKVHREALVKRSLLVRIAAAWVITVPASASIAAVMFYTIRGFILP